MKASISETIEWLCHHQEFGAASAVVRAYREISGDFEPAFTDRIAKGLYHLGRFDDAAEAALETLKLTPDLIPARQNFERILEKIDAPERERGFYSRALEIAPRWPAATIRLSQLQCERENFEGARELLERALERYERGDVARSMLTYHLAWYEYRRGNFGRGLEMIIENGERLGWNRGPMFSVEKPKLAPGISIEGKSILVVADVGVGDEFANARFARSLAERGAKVAWATKPQHFSIFSRIPGVDSVIPLDEAGDFAFDYWISVLELPAVMEARRENLPLLPKLEVLEPFREMWEARLGPRSGRMRVGVRWRGGDSNDRTFARSIPFDSFRRIFDEVDADFHSLHVDDLPEETHPRLKSWKSELIGWEDTLALAHSLDLVISTCTSVPHLSATIGRPTWVLTRAQSYPAWLGEGDTSFWYPSVKVFRERAKGDWSASLKNIARELARLASLKVQIRATHG